MIKNLILKFNNFIQWTKKWIVCHLFINALIFLFIYGLIVEFPNSIDAFLDILTAFAFFICLAFFYILPISLIISIIEHIIKKRLFVKNNFLLNNKIYNLYYIFSFIFMLLCCIVIVIGLFPYSTLFFITYIIALILFILLKKIITKIINIIEYLYHLLFTNKQL